MRNMISTFLKVSVLSLIVIAEILIGTFILKTKLNKSQILGVIDKKMVNFSNNSEHQYYFSFEPNETITQNPPWLKTTATQTINEDTLNERYNYELEKDPSTFRIITLGDSFTYGYLVNTPENWTEQLEDLLNQTDFCPNITKFEVINLGMPGDDIDYIVKRYIEVGSKYKPDLIVWYESGTGFSRFREIMQPYAADCEEKKQNMSTDFHACDELAKENIKNEYSKQQLETMLEAKLDLFFENSNAKLFYFTEKDFWDDSLLTKEEKRKLLEKWRLKYNQATFISSIPTLHKNNGVLADGHPNVYGHSLIAKTILHHLKGEISLNYCTTESQN